MGAAGLSPHVCCWYMVRLVMVGHGHRNVRSGARQSVCKLPNSIHTTMFAEWLCKSYAVTVTLAWFSHARCPASRDLYAGDVWFQNGQLLCKVAADAKYSAIPFSAASRFECCCITGRHTASWARPQETARTTPTVEQRRWVMLRLRVMSTDACACYDAGG